MQRLSDIHLLALLADDLPLGDLMMQTLGMGAQAAQLSFAARQPMTVAATEEAARLLELADGAEALLWAEAVAAGADFLVSSAPYSAAPKDVQVTFNKL